MFAQGNVLVKVQLRQLGGGLMNQGKARHPSAELVTLLRLEEGARSCTPREQARALIREADQVKRHLWGTTEGTIAAHD